MIRDLKAYSIFNSKGGESLLVRLSTEKGRYQASVPSGTSTGEKEAVVAPFARVKKALLGVKKEIIGMDESDQEAVDIKLLEIDGTDNFSAIGSNLSLGISLACARAATDNDLWRISGLNSGFPLPVCNTIGGGAHGGGTVFQEFLLLPKTAESPADAFKKLLEAWSSVGDELARRKTLLGRNIENAWMTSMDDTKTLSFMADVADDWSMDIGVDFAASGFWNGRAYAFGRQKKELSGEKYFSLVADLARQFRIYYLEDPFHEHDFDSFSRLTQELGKDRLIAGDDLLCTNPDILQKHLKAGPCNAVIVKPNQIGTLSQAQRFVAVAKTAGIVPVPSHRSGETEDSWIADLAVAWSAPFIKIGMLGSDTPKHNRLVELWEQVPDARIIHI